MKNKLSHLTCFALALAAIFCGSTLWYASREKAYENELRAANQREASQLLSSLSMMDAALEKLSFTPEGAMRELLAAQLWQQSQQASVSLAALPYLGEPLERLDKYLSQVGDYAYYLLKSEAYDRGNAEEWKALFALCGQSEACLECVSRFKEQMDAGQADFCALGAKTDGADGYSQALSAADRDFPEYAALIYDGPYSDHIAQREALALRELETISLPEARKEAAAILGVQSVTDAGKCSGQIPSYCFSNGTCTVTLSKMGGKLLSLYDERILGERTVSPEQAVRLAIRYAESVGYPDMKETYYTVYENIVTVNLACQKGQILAYPDLIKVGVALDDGSVVRFDALGYCMNHRERAVTSPAFSQDEARKKVPDFLKITDEKEVFLPSSGQNETLCWQFTCETEDKRHVLLFFDATDGQLADLLLLIEDANGTLTR